MKKLKGKRSGVKTLQAAEPYSVSNGPIKTNSENIGEWRMIYDIGHCILILLIVQSTLYYYYSAISGILLKSELLNIFSVQLL